MTGSILGLLAACFLAPSFAAAQTPASGTGGTTDQPAPANAPPKPAEARFDILDYVVDGNTVLSVRDIEEAIYPFLGEQRSAADVDSARAALENAYIA